MKRLITLITFVFVFVLLVGCKTTNNNDKDKFTVTFDVNGGINTVDSQTVEKGSAVTKPSDPNQDGHLFDFWTLNGEKFDFAIPIEENITLVAQWKKVFLLPPGDRTKVFFENYNPELANIKLYESHNTTGTEVEKNSDGTYTVSSGIYCYSLRNKTDKHYIEYNKILFITEEKIAYSKKIQNALFIDAFEGFRTNDGTETNEPIGLLNDESVASDGARGTGNLTSYNQIDRYQTPAFKRIQEGKTHTFTTIHEIGEFLLELKSAKYEYSKYMHYYVVGYSEKYQLPIYAVLFTTANVEGLSYEEAIVVANSEAFENSKVRIMHVATVHGNEHSPSEGELAIIYQLAKGTYTDGVTSDIASMDDLFSKASFLIMPRLNVDGAYEVERYQQARQIDPNRDKLVLQTPENQAAVKLYNLYEADLVIDGHELFGDQILYSNGYARVEVQIGPKNPSFTGNELAMYSNSQLIPYSLQVLNTENIVASPYDSGTGIVSGANYHSLTGALNILIEVRGQGVGLDYYERRVYSYVTANKALTDKVIMDAREFNYSEELSRRNYVTSKNVDSWFDLKTSDSVLNMVERRRDLLRLNQQILVLESQASGITRFGDVIDYYGNGNAGRFTYDGKIISGDTIRNLNFHDIFVKTRELPDGYFVDAQTFLGRSNRGGYHHTTLKEIFDNHSIEYYYIGGLNDAIKVQQLKVTEFDTYPLKMAPTSSYKTQYEVVANVIEKPVTTDFATGVYYIPMTQLRSLLVAFLLEQDIYDNMRGESSLSNNNVGALNTSIYGAGYLSKDSDNCLPIYRYYEEDNSNVNLPLINSYIVKKLNESYIKVNEPLTLTQNGILDLTNLYLATKSNNDIEYTPISQDMLFGLKKNDLGLQTIRITETTNENNSTTVEVYVVGQITKTSNVVYVRSNGGDDSNDGLSDLKAVRTLLRAYEILADNSANGSGTIVICGSLNYSEVYDSLPIHAGLITITAKHGELDYTENGELVLFKDMNLTGPTTFDNITIRNGALQGSRTIYANGNALIIESSVNTISGGLYYPSIVGGSQSGVLESNTDITIKSGTWRNFFGGSYRGVLVGNVNISINGGTFENMFYGGVYQLTEGDNILTEVYLEGNVTVEIYDGYFICGVYGGSNYGDIKGNTKVIIHGGTYEKAISPNSNRGTVTGNQELIDNR